MFHVLVVERSAIRNVMRLFATSAKRLSSLLMSNELLGPRKGDCECGCGLFGTLIKHPENHVRGCKCPKCRGRRNRSKGDSKARRARKMLLLDGANTRHEEHWRGALRVEVKAGKQIEAINVRFLSAELQSKQSCAVGDIRPFAMIAMPDNTTDGIVLMRLSEFAQFMALLKDVSEQ